MRLPCTIVEELREVLDDRISYRLLVQFGDDQSLARFIAESDHYAVETDTTTALPPGMRRDLFNALESISTVTVGERTGRRLSNEGYPDDDKFFLDVDLWNPGAESDYFDLLSMFRAFVEARDGRVIGDPLRIPSMILVKLEANASLLNDLLQLDLVALIDLPPIPIPEDAFDILRQPLQIPVGLPDVPADGPAACIVDSGVVAGHPLLRGVVVSEEDFDSGEGTSVDQNGHGTQVGGLVVYGDIARRIQDGDWAPQVNLHSAKVLKNEENPIDPLNPNAVFVDEERVEAQLKRAIQYFHREYGCRVFNLSIGHSGRIYEGGRQLPWAELLDELARTLDLVIVVSAGNVPYPDIPAATDSANFQEKVARSLRHPEHRLIDPATAALCLTVGAVARRDDPYPLALGTRLAAARQGGPSPFTRCGPGVARSIKPELVAPGGNYAVDSFFGQPTWIRQDPNLAEPTLSREFATGSQLRSVCGTSYAAAQVTHIAARMEATLREQLGTAPTQNLVRALLVDSARPHRDVKDYVGNNSTELLNTIGYGQPNVEFCWSSRNRVSLLSEDSVAIRSFHVYKLVVPEDFLHESGRRSISISLAYDPPTRLSRQDYISTSMWL